MCTNNLAIICLCFVEFPLDCKYPPTHLLCTHTHTHRDGHTHKCHSLPHNTIDSTPFNVPTNITVTPRPSRSRESVGVSPSLRAVSHTHTPTIQPLVTMVPPLGHTKGGGPMWPRTVTQHAGPDQRLGAFIDSTKGQSSIVWNVEVIITSHSLLNQALTAQSLTLQARRAPTPNRHRRGSEDTRE